MLMGLSVVKYGVSTGMTSGKVVGINKAEFYVECNEITQFAVPGDSGSLVLDAVSGDILGIVIFSETFQLSRA